MDDRGIANDRRPFQLLKARWVMAMNLAIISLRRSWTGGSRDYIGVVLREDSTLMIYQKKSIYDVLDKDRIAFCI